jgi:hypothetical protein
VISQNRRIFDNHKQKAPSSAQMPFAVFVYGLEMPAESVVPVTRPGNEIHEQDRACGQERGVDR